jgi:hypothetical protein
MRWTLSKSDPEPAPLLTRALQNWKWARRDPTKAVVEQAATAEGSRPTCLTTVVLNGAILDFEAFALVVGGARHLLSVRLFRIAAALWFAEGEEVSAAYLSTLHPQNASQESMTDMLARDIRRLRAKALSEASGVLVARTAQGYRLDRVCAHAFDR